MVTRRSAPRKKRATHQRRGHSSVNAAFGGEPARRGGLWVAVVLGALVLVNLYVFVWDKKTSVGAVKRIAESKSAVIPGQPLDPNAPAPAPVPSAPVVAVPPARPVAPAAVSNEIDGKVGKGDSLGRVLKHAGLTGAETDEVIRALDGVLDFKSIRAGESFKIERGSDGRVKLFELSVSKGEHVRAERDASGALVGKPRPTAAAVTVRPA